MGTVKENHDDPIQLFEHVIQSPQNFDHKSIYEAQGFLQSLSSFDFNILLIMYALIFPFTEYLFNIFQSKSMDILFCSSEVENTITKLEELRTNKFDEIWKVVMSKCGFPTRKVQCNLQPELQYKTLFFEIIDAIVMQIKQRFKSVKDIEFVELLDCKRFYQYENITKFPERSFQSLQRSYSSHFDFACLRTELAVLHSHNHFRKNNVHKLLKYMHEGQLYGFR